MAKVFFNYADRKLYIKNKTWIKQFVEEIFTVEKKKIDRIDYVFCSDSYLLEINRGFLSHNYYTDIITFDLSEIANGIKGEIYISIDRVKENAKRLTVTFEEELLRIIFHGALHLCGYKDRTKSDKQTMRAREDYYLKRFKTFHKTRFL